MQRVSLVKCQSYSAEEVEKAVERSIELLGGISGFVRPGMKVLLKCNLLMKKKPEECVTTHPAVVEAMAVIVKRAGAIPIIADSPGGPYMKGLLKSVYSGCGMEEVAKRTGAVLNYNTKIADVCLPDARIAKKITVMAILNEVDAVISLPKLKTHGMCTFTGAVKNLFGVVPGMSKMEYHFRMKEKNDFSDMLIDVCSYVKPVLSVMDAVIGMEGNGPSAGQPRSIGAILASDSPYAIDVASTSLVGIPAEIVATIRKADERGLCSSNRNDLMLLGDSFKELCIKDFKLPDTASRGVLHKLLEVGGDSRMFKLLKTLMEPKPVFINKLCINCGDCERYCPPKAISNSKYKPAIDMDKCIKCYCCHELCPEKAIFISRNGIFKLLN